MVKDNRTGPEALEDSAPVVDEAAVRALRAAVRPGLPDAAVAAPIVVGFVSASRADTTTPGEGEGRDGAAPAPASSQSTIADAPSALGDSVLTDAAVERFVAPTARTSGAPPSAAPSAAPEVGRDAPPTSSLVPPTGEAAVLAAADPEPEIALEGGATPGTVAEDEEPAIPRDEDRPLPMADPPRLDLADAVTDEDTPVPITISAWLDDRDGLGGEILSVTIIGLPPGATLSAGRDLGGGTWFLVPSELEGLTLTPGRDWSGAVTLEVRAISRTDNGTEAVTVGSLGLRVEAVADAPFVAASGGGAEDTAIDLGARAAAVDIDGSETIVSVLIFGVPEGAVLSAGVRLADGSWSIPPDALPGLTLTPPEHFSGEIALRLVASSAEPNGSTATSEHGFTVTVAPVADAPAAAAADAAGAEDGWIALAGLSASLIDRDGSETLVVRIEGVPDGARLSHGTASDGGWIVPVGELGSLSILPPADFAGTIALTLVATAREGANGDSAVTAVPFTVTVAPVVDAAPLSASASGFEDRWISIDAAFGALSDASERWAETVLVSGVPDGAFLNAGEALGGGVWRVPTDALAAGAVAILPPEHSDAEIPLTLTATVIDSEGGFEARGEVTATLTVRVDAVADAPVVSVADVHGQEDQWIGLDGLSAALVDTDGSETLGVTISGVPAGGVLSAGTANPDGSWTVPAAALATLSFLPPPHASGSYAFTVTASATEGDASAAPAVTSASFTVTVAPVADEATLSVSGSGNEDSWIPITAAFATPDSDGSETYGAATTISGLPPGALLSQGAEIAPGVWTVATAELLAGRVSVQPPANSDADLPLTFTTSVIDRSGDLTDERAVTTTANIIVRAVADRPDVHVADAAGLEDQWIPLTGLGGALTDTDGSEALSFRISGMPSGAKLSVGTKLADGSWSLTPAQLATASFLPPSHQAGTYTLSLTAVATEARDGGPSATRSATFSVSVDPVADQGTITITGRGDEDSWITIGANFATPDRDGSEAWSATTTVTGVPAGALLSQGTEVSPGSWIVSTAALRAGEVSIRPPADSDADITLAFSAVLTDTGNGTSDQRTITGSGTVVVNAVADAPVIAVADSAGDEDQWIPLAGLSAALTDTDGSETLTVTIAGLPAGAQLSHGTAQGGVWTVAASDLSSLSILPPRDFSGTIALSLTAVSAEARDGSSATMSAGFSVHVEAVADAPTIRVVAAAGAEDHAIPLTLYAATTDRDGSETITGFRVANVPEGAVLATAAGRLSAQPDGSFVVPVSQLGSLTITPPPNSDADFVLSVSSISAEPNGSTAESITVALPVTVHAVADAPLDVRGGATVLEDQPVPLGIGARLADADGSEILSFVVSGVPQGMSLSVGTYAGPGRWSLTAEEAEGAALIVPRDYSGTLSLTLTAVAQERNGGSMATTTTPLPVTITAVVDNPAVGGIGSAARWATAHGAEDSAIALKLDPGLRDSDGSESVVGTILIAGVPAGASLRYADGTAIVPDADGIHAVPASRMGEVRIIPPADSDVAFDLSITMTIEDQGSVSETISGVMTVDPRGVADAPMLSVEDGSGAAHGSSDPSAGWLPLPVTAALTDTDGSEQIRLVVYGLPAGFKLSAGHSTGDGTWVLPVGEASGISIRPPAGFAGEVSLEIRAISTEREGDSASVTQPLTLTIVAEGGGAGGGDNGGGGEGGGGGGGQPGEGGGGEGAPGEGSQALAVPVLTATLADGVEDQPIPIAISATHAGGGTGDVALSYVISDLPTGASLTAGFHDPVSGRWVLTEADLPGLAVIPPRDYAGPITLTVRAVATDALGATEADTGAPAAMIEAVADAPTIGASPAAGIEDQVVALNLSVTPGDRDGSETVIAVTIGNLPAGATLVGDGVTDNGDGTFTVDPATLGTLGILPPENAHGSYSLTVTVTVAEGSNGDERTATRTVGFTVAPEPDAPVLIVAAASGLEDNAVPLSISAALVDTDGSESLSIVISGLPVGARLSAGVNNGDGSWTLRPTELAGLTVTPPGDFSGTIAATVTAFSVERSTGEVAATTAPLAISVAGVSDGVILDAAGAASGLEDTAIPIAIAATLRDRDGSETLTVVATGVPEGAQFSAGVRNQDGSWSFAAADLPGLAYTPPLHASGATTLRFTVTATEADGDARRVTTDMTITVTPVADGAVIETQDASALEGTTVPLSLSVLPIDADGSEEVVAITITGLPEGARLTAGQQLPDGSWRLAPAELDGLGMVPRAGWSGSATLSVSAETREIATDERVVNTATIAIAVEAVADAPLLTVTAASGQEDHAVALSIGAALGDTDGSEVLTGITIAGLPPGAVLSAGTDQGDGTWLLGAAELTGLRLIPAPDWFGSVALTVTAESRELSNDDRASSTASLSVTIAPMPDAPVLSIEGAHASEAASGAAAMVGTALIVEVDGEAIISATIALGSGRQETDRITLDGIALVPDGDDLLVGDTGIRIVGGGLDEATGTLRLVGAAAPEVYASVIERLILVDETGGSLIPGARDISVTLTDAGGDSTTERLSVLVGDTVLVGDGTGGALAGGTGDDVIIGSAADETLRGGAGNDLFLIGADGGHDTVEGGEGFDTVMLGDAAGPPVSGPPPSGGWTVVLDDAAVTWTEGENTLDFSEPASGRIVFGDGAQIDFSQIERITW